MDHVVMWFEMIWKARWYEKPYLILFTLGLVALAVFAVTAWVGIAITLLMSL